MNPKLRRATVEDFPFARAVHHSSYRGWVVDQFGAWDEDLQDRFFHRPQKPVRLRAFKANQRAISFYRHIGFVETGATDLQVLFEWPNQGDCVDSIDPSQNVETFFRQRRRNA